MNNLPTKRTQEACDSMHEHPVVPFIDDAQKSDNGIQGMLNTKSARVFKIVLVTFSVLVMVSCNSSADKVENAQEEVTEAKEDLNKAQAEYRADVDRFRRDIDAQLSTNEKQIADFNDRLKEGKNDVSDSYKKQIAEIEEENRQLRRRMSDYKADSKENWNAFKSEFNRDMDELGTALKNLTKDNNK